MLTLKTTHLATGLPEPTPSKYRRGKRASSPGHDKDNSVDYLNFLFAKSQENSLAQRVLTDFVGDEKRKKKARERVASELYQP